MSREWVDDHKSPPRTGPDTRDKRWVMRCDCWHQDHGIKAGQERRCKTKGEPSPTQPPLEPYRVAGWFIARSHGDRCPECLAMGHDPISPEHD